ncbi:uncharacterized protein LOC129602261 isoform X2 [Paramacrobiotus metropolitanus]|uniref:uncharacterized protein LOC129602261 isoform X2 n=1 Tax=Paramacrobiotus metropolitanus TaxID=2943436 RepID=UPI002445B412|nr:uncharacterized protein LOC129602261 isoform X2 [Paramacrobiotus metropolitanus]
MFEALCKQWKKRSGPMNLKIVRKERNKMFPEWTSDLTQLFPSQIIPDKIITPTVIKGGKVEYVCNVESCAEADVSFPHSGFLYLHFQQHHSHRYGLPTKFYYACVDKGAHVGHRRPDGGAYQGRASAASRSGCHFFSSGDAAPGGAGSEDHGAAPRGDHKQQRRHPGNVRLFSPQFPMSRAGLPR